MKYHENPQYFKDRNRRIYEERKAGATLQELASRYDLSRERIRVIALREDRLEIWRAKKAKNNIE